ncbi:outer membrane protein OmpA-like peptidoglycan-associated protein [Parvibaculum sp. MBR-TMA-1.3b-4.2]
MMILKKFAIVMVCSSLGLAACTTQDPYTGEQQTSSATKGALLGGLAGAIGGALIGRGGANRNAILLGAGVGALAGGAIGNYMDRQEAELTRKLRNSGVSVTRVGNDIILNMPGNVTFATNSSDISSNFYEVLNSVAIVLKEYNKTLIDVAGFTDSTGSAQYNQALSERRANSVAQYLVSQGLDSRRFYVTGMGESNPIASNATAEGRAQNRRVEIRLSPLTNN